MTSRRRTFRRGDEVQLVRGNYPVRYMGRFAPIVGSERVRGRRRFLLDFSPRREEPLAVAASHIEPAE